MPGFLRLSDRADMTGEAQSAKRRMPSHSASALPASASACNSEVPTCQSCVLLGIVYFQALAPTFRVPQQVP